MSCCNTISSRSSSEGGREAWDGGALCAMVPPIHQRVGPVQRLVIRVALVRAGRGLAGTRGLAIGGLCFDLPDDRAHQLAPGGVRHLRYLLDRFQGNVPLALAAYNAGETRVSRESRIPRIGETREYVRRVLRYYKDYRQEDLHTSSEIRPRIDGLSYVSSN